MAKLGGGKTLHRIRRDNAFYLAIAPFLVIFVVFSVFPVLFSLYLGFNRWDGFSDPQWVGLENYTRALGDPVFQKGSGTRSICGSGRRV